MTVLSPLTDKDYEGLRRVLRSLQVRRRVAAPGSVTGPLALGGGVHFSLVALRLEEIAELCHCVSCKTAWHYCAEEYLQ